MTKHKNLSLEEFISETTTNIREDRAMAKSLLMDTINDMKITDTARHSLGPIAAKYIENLQRSNEQLVKLATLVQKQKSQQFGLTTEDKDQLFDLLKEESPDGLG
tara:strand:+ start:481 stop:795 length:315 start_codon:yes stop_codon:yes gene_type:complete